MCVTYIQPFGVNQWQEYHRTETIQDNHNPDFVSKVHLPYKFEEQQPLKFEIYDVDSNSRNLENHDFSGFAVCNLAQIISSGKVFASFTIVMGVTRYFAHSCENRTSLLLLFVKKLAAITLFLGKIRKWYLFILRGGVRNCIFCKFSLNFMKVSEKRPGTHFKTRENFLEISTKMAIGSKVADHRQNFDELRGDQRVLPF